MVSLGHVVPVKKRIEIDIPADYINTEIEILLLPIEKHVKEKRPKESILSLQGSLGDVDYEPAMKKNAWEAAVEEKRALNIFVNQKVDIVDALLLSSEKQCLGILSFDKDLKK